MLPNKFTPPLPFEAPANVYLATPETQNCKGALTSPANLRSARIEIPEAKALSEGLVIFNSNGLQRILSFLRRTAYLQLPGPIPNTYNNGPYPLFWG